MAFSWPSSLPKPMQSGFSMQPEDRRTASSTIGTSFSNGFGGDVCSVDCTVFLSPAQCAAFEKFERDTLVQGAKWFKFPIWYGGEVHSEFCRFKTRPKASNRHGLWMEYSFSLYVQKRSELFPDCLTRIFACWHPCWFFEFNDSLLHVFNSLSHITDQTVGSALAELYEE